MSLSTFFGFAAVSNESDELPDIFPMVISKTDFVEIDVVGIYAKILTDVLERTDGLDDKMFKTLWDSCVKSDSTDGLITLLSKAIAEKKDLFLVYDSAIGIVRVATMDEQAQIKNDYKTKATSEVGTYISFSNYKRSDMVKLYSAMEYLTISALHKNMNVSKALQIKINDLRASNSLTDAAISKAQASKIAKGLGAGKDIYLDAKDLIDTTTPDIASVDAAINFINSKRAFYLGMPTSYIDGIQTSGMGSTGEQDTKAVERGLKNYYYSIIKPVVESLYGITTNYKSQDFRQFTQGLEAIKTFSLVDEELISLEDKKRLVAQLFDFESTINDQV